MIKNPIQEVTNKLQYRAIGIVNGVYKPHDNDQLNRGVLKDNEGEILETVVLGKALSLLKKYINLEKNYYWIVYPRNKNTNNLHLQVAGIWDPYKLNKVDKNNYKKDPNEILEDLNLNNNYFSIRGELIYVNTQKKEIVIKICSSSTLKKLKKNIFKIVIEGDLSLNLLNSFVSLDVLRCGNTLKMVKYEVIEKVISKNK
tara:strand:- start:817 stop:1416 length:600 start_codon:yes stop_codon:yes gene_type:complete